MSTLKDRVWALEIGQEGGQGLRYEGLDMKFLSKFNNLSKPTICDITVFNPGHDFLGRISSDNVLIRALAGYESMGATEIGQGIVVSGSLTDLSKSADPQISFQISKGRQIFSKATLSKSWSSVGADEIVEYIRQQIGVSYDIVEFAKNPFYARGYTLSGSPSQALSSLIKDCGSQYTLTDGRLRIWPLGKHAKILSDIWAADSGLQDCQPKGSGKTRTIDCIALLRPGLRSGDVVTIESPQYDGRITILEGSHEIDTTADAWSTTSRGVPYAG